MESGTGMGLVDESVVVDKAIVGDSILDTKKEEGEEVLCAQGDAENAVQGIDLSSGIVLESKMSNPGEVSGVNSKNSKTSKRPTLNKATTMTRKEKPSLTQSRSFPAKGFCASAISKSVDAYQTQSSAKHSGASRLKGEAQLSYLIADWCLVLFANVDRLIYLRNLVKRQCQLPRKMVVLLTHRALL